MLDFYKNKRVLITGDTGFKGTWLSLILHDAGAEVLGISDKPPRQNDSFYSMIHMSDFIKHRNVDVRDYKLLRHVMDEFKPDIVFHLAAQPLVRTSYEKPLDTFDINVMGSVNLLECVRLSDTVKSFVLVTTDKVYKDRDWIWGYRECDDLGGIDPYSASKSMTESAFNSYLKSFFSKQNTGVATARGGNVVGGGDFSKDRLIPDCFRSLADGKPVLLRNPRSIRPWQHVLELLKGYLMLGEYIYGSPELSGNWNFGPAEESFVDVETMVMMFLEAWGSGSYIADKTGENLKESNILMLDSTKAMRVLNWNPVFTVKEVIDLTARWYKNVIIDKENPLEVSRAQIERVYGKEHFITNIVQPPDRCTIDLIPGGY